MSVRVLHSFPHKIGAERIAMTAWHEAAGAAAAGADVTVAAGVVHRPLPATVHVTTTLSRGRWRLPYKALGTDRTLALHDRLVASSLRRRSRQFDVVHAWPLAARETLLAAKRLGIPTVLERPNAHTRFAYEVVAQECERLGVALPPDHEHAFNADRLRKEEEEYALADYILCPSEFVVKTFRDQGFPDGKLLRHAYGYDERRYHAPEHPRASNDGLTVLFVGVCAVRKGLHFALEAWLQSPASRNGLFLIAGEFLPAYQELLAPMLAHPSVRVLGHRNDVPDLMRSSDVLLLPSIEEGFGLVCVDALACGCVPLVSDACTDACQDGVNALVHHVADVAAIEAQLTALHEDRGFLERLRAEALRTAPDYTWDKAGVRLVHAYEQAVDSHVFGPAGSGRVALAAAG